MLIYHSKSIQTLETAQLITNKFNIPLIETLLLQSVDLGRLNGISDTEAQKNYPNDFQLMCQWRKREIEIDVLTAIGMEQPKEFWNRGVEFLTNLTQKNNIIVCSTSVMILLIHILCQRTYINGNGYYHIPIKNAQIVCFNITDNNVTLDKKITDEEMLKYC